MAKKTSKRPVLSSTAALAKDAANPRKITKKAAAGLAKSLEEFGDLSGIVWNKKTRELVCGHQRMDQIREKWGEREIECVDADRQLYGISIDGTHFFPVRVVNWTKAKQRLANVAANNQKIAGTYTEDLAVYLMEVEAEIKAESPPELLDELLMADLLVAEAAANEKEATVSESYQVLVQCTSEKHQRQVYAKLQKEGLACKVLTI